MVGFGAAVFAAECQALYHVARWRTILLKAGHHLGSVRGVLIDWCTLPWMLNLQRSTEIVAEKRGMCCGKRLCRFTCGASHSS